MKNHQPIDLRSLIEALQEIEVELLSAGHSAPDFVITQDLDNSRYDDSCWRLWLDRNTDTGVAEISITEN